MKEKLNKFLERAASLVVGVSLVVMGFGLIVLGVTFLPVIGIFAGIGLMSLSVYFFNPKVLEVSQEDEVACFYEEDKSWCQWPPTGFKRHA